MAAALLAALPLACAAQQQTLRFPPDLEAPLLLAADAANTFDVVVDTQLPFGPAQGGSERLVKGAPYCADAIHETVQPLLDAGGGSSNRIVRQTTTRLCRDGEGRTRQEVERGGRKLVILRDPVTRETWVLDPERKTARRSGISMVMSSPQGGAVLDQSVWHDYAERMREWASQLAERARAARPGAASAPAAPLAPASPVPPAAPKATAPRAPGDVELVVIARQAAEMAQREAAAIRLQLLGADVAGAPSTPPTPPAVSWAAHRFAPRGEGVLTSLGPKEMEGLRVNGERTTWTIEAGKVGNEKPIQIVRDVWTAPDLMLTVATRDFDPRRGETNYRLANVKRGEPDAALMKVPADHAKPAPRAASVRG
jgi:hypothetical protein